MMLSEKEMENQIASHPERFLGERRLSIIARQFRIGGYIFDLLFEDRHGGKLIVEIQKGTLDRNHTYKILDYYDEYREQNPHEFIDVMVVANQITSERKKRLHALGVEFRELPVQLFDQVSNKQPGEAKPTNEDCCLSSVTDEMISPDDLVSKLTEIGFVARQNSTSQPLFVNLGGPQSPINKNIERFKGCILLNPKISIAFGTCNMENILHFRNLLMSKIGREWERREGVPGEGKRVTLDFDFEGKQTSGKNRMICRTQNGEIYLDGYVGQLLLREGLYKWEEVKQFQKVLTSCVAKRGKRTIKEHLSVCTPELRILFETFRMRVKEIDQLVQENSWSYGVAYRASQNFVEVYFRKNRLEVCLRPTQYRDPENLLGKVPHNKWTLNRRFILEDASRVDYLIALVRQSYENVS